MPPIESCEWEGKSGQVYTYQVYALLPTFKPDQLGNYIFTRLDDEGVYQPVYIGEGDLRERITPQHHKAQAITDCGATHVHVHLNRNDVARKAEERDLIAGYPMVLSPIGCNDRLTG